MFAPAVLFIALTFGVIKMGKKGLELNPVDRVLVTRVKVLDEAVLHHKYNRLSAACLLVLDVLTDENIVHNGAYTSALNARKIIEEAVMFGHIDDCFPKEICQL